MKTKFNNKFITIASSIISLITIIICLICNYFINHTLSWSLIVLFSILLLDLLIIPSLILPKSKKALGSLISLSVFIIPYFFILNLLLDNFDIFKIGSISSIITLLYLWGTYLIAHKLANHGLKGAALELLLTAMFSIIINITLSIILSSNTFTFINVICIVLLLLFSLICFIYDHKYKN